MDDETTSTPRTTTGADATTDLTVAASALTSVANPRRVTL